MSLPFTLVHAADTKPFNPVKEGCKGAGYTWNDTLGCANKPCRHPAFGVGRPSQLYGSTKDFAGWICNGFTGEWELF